MKVLVTGGAGHIGAGVCRILQQAGHEVRAADRRLNPELPLRIEVANLLDPLAAYRLLDGMEAVVHLANHRGFYGRDAQMVFNENMTMNFNVLEATRQLGMRKVVFASSIQAITGARGTRGPEVPSALPYLPLDGDVPPNPGNPYALSKQATEVMLAYYARQHGLSAVALRFPWTVADEDLNDRPTLDHLTSSWRYNMDEGFTYLAVSDAARLVEAILRSDLPGFRIYFPAAPDTNVGLPPAELIQRFYPTVPLRRPAAELKGLVDTSRIEKETGWRPQALFAARA